jgi:UDP-perosamine 4-acetyltransferase
MITLVTIPRVNVNDDEVRVIRWLVPNGGKTRKGDALCEVESTKATIEIPAPTSGFVAHLVNPKDLVPVGKDVGAIAETEAELAGLKLAAPGGGEAGQVFSQAAKAAMKRLGVSMEEMAGIALVTAEDVEARHMRKGPVAQRSLPQAIPGDDVAIYGTGSRAVLAYDALSAAGISVPAFIDFEIRFAELLAAPVISAAVIADLKACGLRRVHIAVPNRKLEERAEEACTAAGLVLVSAIHPTASVSASAKIGRNVFVGACATVGPLVMLGDFCRILTCASVAHHSRLQRDVQVSDGARIAGHCEIGEEALIGLNASVSLHLRLGRQTVVVSGAVAGTDVPDRHVVRSDGKFYPRPT